MYIAENKIRLWGDSFPISSAGKFHLLLVVNTQPNVPYAVPFLVGPIYSSEPQSLSLSLPAVPSGSSSPEPLLHAQRKHELTHLVLQVVVATMWQEYVDICSAAHFLLNHVKVKPRGRWRQWSTSFGKGVYYYLLPFFCLYVYLVLLRHRFPMQSLC